MTARVMEGVSLKLRKEITVGYVALLASLGAFKEVQPKPDLNLEMDDGAEVVASLVIQDSDIITGIGYSMAFVRQSSYKPQVLENSSAYAGLRSHDTPTLSEHMAGMADGYGALTDLGENDANKFIKLFLDQLMIASPSPRRGQPWTWGHGTPQGRFCTGVSTNRHPCGLIT
eukprot:gene12863-3765_t